MGSLLSLLPDRIRNIWPDPPLLHFTGRIDHRHGAEQQEMTGHPFFSGSEDPFDPPPRLFAIGAHAPQLSHRLDQRGDDNVILRAPTIAVGVRLLSPILPAPDAHPVEQRPPLPPVQQLLEDLLDLERIVHDDIVAVPMHRQLLPGLQNALLAEGGIQYGEGPDGVRGAAIYQGLIEFPGVANDFEDEPFSLVTGRGRSPKKVQPAIVPQIVLEVALMICLRLVLNKNMAPCV